MDIRPAATLVLTRDTENGIEVLLLQRTWEAIFLPGYYVFPGGAVNEQESEAQPHVVGVEDADISQTMSLDEGGADFMLAAVRECFEEAGFCWLRMRMASWLAQTIRCMVSGRRCFGMRCRWRSCVRSMGWWCRWTGWRI